jgi:hypothetical protein
VKSNFRFVEFIYSDTFRASDPEDDNANKKRLKKSAENAMKAALNQPLPKSTLSFLGPTNTKGVI